MFNIHAYEDDAPVRKAIRVLIERLEASSGVVITLRRTDCGLSLEPSNEEKDEHFVGLDLAERIQMRLRVMANIDILHPGLIHGQYELGDADGLRVLSVRSNRTPTFDEVSITLDAFGSEPSVGDPEL